VKKIWRRKWRNNENNGENGGNGGAEEKEAATSNGEEKQRESVTMQPENGAGGSLKA